MIYLANNFLDSSLQNHKRQMRPSILFGEAIIQFSCNFEYKLWQLTVLIQAEITQETRKPSSPSGIATRPRSYKTVVVLNSNEHELSLSNKNYNSDK